MSLTDFAVLLLTLAICSTTASSTLQYLSHKAPSLVVFILFIYLIELIIYIAFILAIPGSDAYPISFRHEKF